MKQSYVFYPEGKEVEMYNNLNLPNKVGLKKVETLMCRFLKIICFL